MTTAYHVTARKNLASIMVYGLKPQKGPRSIEAKEPVDAVYCFASVNDCEQALLNWLGEAFDEGEEIVVIELNIAGKLIDEGVGWEISVQEPIEATRILRVFSESEFEDLLRSPDAPGYRP